MLLAASLALAMTAAGSPELPDNPRMNWWREAKFGLFIHWGLYAVPAGEWNGVKTYGEWIRESARIPVDTYAQFLGQFNPVKYDPDAWVRMAKDAGMKYVVITSKHHDGFALYDSKLTDWDVASTPYKKDILQMLKDACDRQGVRFCTYHSIMDWHHPDYLPRRGWEAANRPATGADYGRFVKYLHGQVEEIATKYDPGIMWFDGQWEGTWNTDLGKDLLALCRRLRPNMIVNNRVNSGPQGGGDYLTPEQEIPEEAIHGKDWETCMTMNGNWGYNRVDLNYKSTSQIIRMLCDIVSKGGNFLLNIGPTAEGEFPPESVKRLKEVGAWMKVNGDAIYGSQASPFGKLPWGRCTLKRKGADSWLYLHVFDWPKDGRIRLPGLGNETVEAHLLEGGEPVKLTRDDSDLLLGVQGEAPDEMASVIALRIKGSPIIYKTPVITADSTSFVSRVTASIESPGLITRYTTDGSEPSASSAIYRAPLVVNRTLTLKARGYHNNRPVTSVVEQKFEKVDPSPAKEFPNLMPGLEVRIFEGNWDKLPELSSMTSGFKTKTLPSVSIADDPAKEFCGRFYTGVLDVPETEMYRFALSSDDGSRLWVSGQLVVNNDGLHGTVEKIGTIALAKGKHLFNVEWFNKTGGAQLSVKWAKLGRPLTEVPASVLFHGGVNLR